MKIDINTEAQAVIEECLEYFPTPKFDMEVGEKPSEEFIKEHKDTYPATLFYIWDRIGFASFGNGGYWLVNPAEYQDLLDICLKDTKFPEHDDFIVIGRSAFGDLLAIGKQTTSKLTIDMECIRIFPYIQTMQDRTEEDYADSIIGRIWINAQKRSFDTIDESLEKIFDRCLASHGRVSKDEIYAFMPPPALGGKEDFYNIQKVDIHQHLNFVAQLEPFTIMMDINAVVDEQGITPDME